MRYLGAAVAIHVFLGLFFGGGLGASAFGQTKLIVEYQGRWLPVTAMDGDFPLVSMDGTLRRVYDGEVRLAPADFYADGGIEISDMNAALAELEDTGEFALRFVAIFSAERTYEAVFLALEATTPGGETRFSMREVGEVPEGEGHRIAAGFPADARLFGGGRLRPRFYTTSGDEIRLTFRQGAEEIVLEGLEGVAAEDGQFARPRIDPQRAFPAKVAHAVYPDYPSELTGTGISGVVKAVFSIDERGRAVEIIDYAAEERAFLPEARRSIAESVYQPARFEGKELVATVAQMFTFNEFVSFAEGLVMIPYPDLQDREPVLLHSPLPEAVGRGQARLLLTVDPLGKVAGLEIEQASEAAAEALREVVPGWVFLSAVEGGFPALRRVSVEIDFGTGRVSQPEPRL